MNAELRRFLDDEVHALAAGERLQQDETEGRLTLDELMLANFYDGFPARETERGLVLAATAVENREWGAVPKSQHLGDMLRRLVAEGDATTWLER
jgi:hypothetical protein